MAKRLPVGRVGVKQKGHPAKNIMNNYCTSAFGEAAPQVSSLHTLHAQLQGRSSTCMAQTEYYTMKNYVFHFVFIQSFNRVLTYGLHLPYSN